MPKLSIYTLMAIVLLAFSQNVNAQIPTYQLTLQNDILVSETIYEFNIFIERTGGGIFELASLQSIFTFNTAISTGTLSFTINLGTSELDELQQPTNLRLSISGNELRIAPNTPPGSGNGTIIPLNTKLRVGRFRLTSSVSFSNQRPNIVWKNSTNPFTKVFAYVDGSNTEITDSTSHINLLTNPKLAPLTITSSSPLPNATAGVAYAETLKASGGDPPYNWSITSGSLPSGLTLSSAGVISGTATLAGTSNFTARVTDVLSSSTSKAFSLTVVANNATQVVFIQQPTNAVAGTTISPPVTVQLRDAFGNNVSSLGVGITLTLSSGTGTLYGTTTRTTNSSGLATFDNLSINLAGSKNLTASSGSITPAVSNAFTISAGVATQLAFVQQPTNTTAGAAISPPITVQLRDGFGNDVASLGVSITMTLSSGTGTLSGTTTRSTNSSGLAAFNDLSINLAGSKNLTASSGLLTSALSNPFSITAGSATQLAFVQQPTNTTAGSTISPPVTVQLRDAFGNNVDSSDVAITMTLSSGTGTLSGTTSHPTNSSGLATFDNLSIDLAGSKTLTASSGSLTSAVSNSFSISSTSATQLAFVQQPTNTQAGAAITPSVTVQVRDTFGNDVAVSGVAITMTLSSGTGILSGTTTRTTNSSGLASFNDLSINLAGSKNLTASSGSLTPAVSNAFTISAGTASQLAFVQQPTNTVAGTTISPAVTVQLRDAFGNDVAALGVEITLTLSSDTGTLSGTTTRSTNSTGLATFDDLSINLMGSKNLTASSGLLTSATSNAFIISAANASQLAFIQQPTNTVAGAIISPSVTVQLRDAFGNDVASIGVAVIMTLSSGTGTLSGTTTRSTNSSGLATFDDLSINQPGTKRFTASDSGLTSAISNEFTLTTYTITASAGSNGTIVPSGDISVNHGADQTFTITPNTGYHIADVLVDGNSVGAVTAYTFDSVTTNHTISASFAPNSLSITVQTNPSGKTIIVDNIVYTSPVTFTWLAGTTHTIETDSLQNVSTGTRHTWTSWSDGGTRKHTVSPLVNTTYTANFKTQFFLTMTANAGGTVSPPSSWYDSAQAVTISATPSSGYSFDGWSGTGSGSYTGFANPRTITMNGPITEIANFDLNDVLITVRTNPPGRSYRVDGTTYTVERTFSFLPGSTHTLSTDSIQAQTASSRYIWTSWSDGGTRSHTIIVPSTDSTYTVNFKTQFFLTMNASTGGTVTPASNWYDSAQVVSISATPNVGYTFSGWSGSGTGSYTGPNNPASITIRSAITETASFTLFPIQVTVQSNPPGRSFIVDGVAYSNSQTFTWSATESHTLSTTTPQTGDSVTRYLWSSWSDGGAMTHSVAPITDTTFIVNFTTQYFLTMIANTGGTVSPVSNWYNSGQVVSISATPSSGYSFSSWTGTGTGSYTGPNNPATVTMNSPITETANFTLNSIQVTVQTVPSGRTVIVDGITYTSPSTFIWVANSSHTISADSIQSGTSGTRYVWSSWSDGGTRTHTVAPLVNTTYTATFRTQYFLTMVANPGGIVTPSNDWFDSGENVTITAIPNSGFSFSSWTGSGTGSYTGTGNPRTITINGPITQIANFTQNPYQVVVQTNPPGRTFRVSGQNYTTPQTFSVPPGNSLSLSIPVNPQSGPTGTQYAWRSWSDSGAISHTVTPISDTVYTAFFTTQFFLTMNAGTGGTVSPASNWYDSAQVVTLTATPNTGSGYSFSGWTGTGNGSYTGPANPATATMQGPITETASFTQFPVQVAITTNPVGDSIMVDGTKFLSPQTFTWTSGSSHTIETDSIQLVSEGIRHVWSNWSD
ncbi:MAG: putative Ig domain-containing protein, partial [Ignavibacteriae bacterium]|nr:putative Ig domain-containing protein [Ignavibacteriota bacterium]